MKNVFILPTDKPSRLLKTIPKANLILSKSITSGSHWENQNIYITNSEEIKEGDWYLTFLSNEVIGQPRKCEDTNWDFSYCKKIILTTDPDLIADGVEAIDDKFIEWFLKNPSCEEVEVGYGWIRLTETNNEGYWVSIPDNQFEMQQAELKQECTCKENDPYCCQIHGTCPTCVKQETLEKAACKALGYDYNDWVSLFSKDKSTVIYSEVTNWCKGAKYMAERMYSEEDMRKAYFSGISSTGEGWNGEYADGNDPNIEEKFSEGFTQWFEQFKKK